MERHYLLSGDADGTILLWELTLADKKVLSGAKICVCVCVWGGEGCSSCLMVKVAIGLIFSVDFDDELLSDP